MAYDLSGPLNTSIALDPGSSDGRGCLFAIVGAPNARQAARSRFVRAV